MIRLRAVVVATMLFTILAGTGLVAVKGSISTGPVPQLVSPTVVVVIVLENVNQSQTYGSGCAGNCSYITSLANAYGFAKNYSSVAHQSLPNYLTLLSGANYSVYSPPTQFGGLWARGCGPSQCGNLTSPTIVDKLQAIGGASWKAYMEDYGCRQGWTNCTGKSNTTAGCYSSNNPGVVGRLDLLRGVKVTDYDDNHNPFLYFQSIAGNYSKTGAGAGNGPGCLNIIDANGNSTGYVLNPNGGLPATLLADLNSTNPPNLAWLSPNNCNNGHTDCIIGANFNSSCTVISDCVTEQNTYLSMVVPKILGSRAFQTGSAALMITWDEGSRCQNPGETFPNCPDLVTTIWAGPAIRQNHLSNLRYSQYSFPTTLELLWNMSQTLAPSDSNKDLSTYGVVPHSVTTPYAPMSEFLKAKPSIGSTVSPSTLTVGSQMVTDNATLAGGYTPTGTITYSLYNDSSCTNKVFTSTGSVGRPSTGYIPNSPGTYQWIAVYNGDANNIAVSTSCGVESLTVTDFIISASPTSLNITQGANSTATVTLTSLAGFNGNVSLTVLISADGPIATLSPSSLVLTASGNSSLLTVKIPSNAATGTYILTIHASSGALLHTTSVNVTVPGGSVGGVVVPINEVGLVTQLVAMLLFPVIALVGLVVFARKSKGQRRKCFDRPL